jgi:hypothetical protein
VETLIKWGRYAELLAYDDDDRRLYVKLACGAKAPTEFSDWRASAEEE